MGKIRTRIIGLEDVEKDQKKEQKRRSEEKKLEKKKIRAPGLKRGERMVAVEVDETAAEKLAKAQKFIQEPPIPKVVEKKSKQKKKPKKSRGERYKKALKMIDKKKSYPLKEAVETLKKIKFASFDESVELHINLIEGGLKGEVELPYATGKTTRVRIADDKTLEEIGKGQILFDILITHPSNMPKLAKFAKFLGPKGLMPNPKAGTISIHPEEVAKKFKKGTLRWKSEAKFPLIHQMIGKISFEDNALIQNAQALFESIGKNKMRGAFIKSTMSPAVKVDLEKI